MEAFANEQVAARCGSIALIGPPNAGKSTLLNRMVGSKISIVTPKAQTTRSRITGVATEGVSQLVFIDVPGVFGATQKFEKAMVAAAWGGAREADTVVFLFDARRLPNEETEQAMERLRHLDKPCYLALNKVDAVENKPTLLSRVAWFSERMAWREIFMISAKSGEGVTELKSALARALPQQPWHYAEDTLTDLPMRLLASELTREQCFLSLQEEIPYTLTVETEKYETRADGSLEIHQIIIVQNERQKTIVIGAKGQMLKKIGERARRAIGALAGTKCHLYLFVKVRADWKEKPETYRYLGLEF
jgi:GTP-binding protein Era